MQFRIMFILIYTCLAHFEGDSVGFQVFILRSRCRRRCRRELIYTGQFSYSTHLPFISDIEVDESDRVSSKVEELAPGVRVPGVAPPFFPFPFFALRFVEELDRDRIPRRDSFES